MTIAAPIFLLVSTEAATEAHLCSFFENIDNVFNIASVAVVAVSLIIAGYQIAFAHKRVTDMAPTVIGGLMIGTSAQIAKLLMPDQGACLGAVTTWVRTLLGSYA